MQPTIRNGDVILIRKRDAGSLLLRLLHWKPPWSRRDSEEQNKIASTPELQRVDYEKGKSTPMKNVTDVDSIDRVKTMFYRMEDDSSYLWVSPAHTSPLVLPGHIIVYRNPYHFPKSLIKRAIAVGGQRVCTSGPYVTPWNEDDDIMSFLERDRTFDCRSEVLYNHPYFQSQSRFRYYVQIPPHFLYTEGDNVATSIHDSRHMDHTPISQNLVDGIAEYVVWPPSRWQRLHRLAWVDKTNPYRRVIWEK